MPREKILIIEDNEGDVDLVREVLEDRVEITWCATAKEARIAVEDGDFELILLDQGLPDSNGLALLSELVASCPECPIVMLTGRRDPTLALSTLEIGAKDYLVKSEVLEHLRPTVERILSQDAAEPLAVGPRFLDTAEDFYPVLMETISEGCLVFDEDGVVTFANGAASSLAQVGSLLGTAVLDLFTEESRPKMARALAELSANPDGVISLKFDARVHSAGAELPVRISMRSLQTGGGTRNGILIATDMSEQVRIQELRDDVVRAMLHDLRAPLHVVSSAVELLKDCDLATEIEDAQEFISVLEQGTERLVGLVQQSFDIERFESGGLPLSRREVDLVGVLRTAVEARQWQAREKSVDIVCDIEDSELHGWCDPKLFGRVLQNLLENAIRHSPREQPVVAQLRRVRGSAEFHGQQEDRPLEARERLRVAIMDRGPGVAPEIAGQLFEKFVRGRNGGSGLGLAFCKIVVDAHEGSIGFEPGNPTGTRFIVELPAQPEPAQSN